MMKHCDWPAIVLVHRVVFLNTPMVHHNSYFRNVCRKSTSTAAHAHCSCKCWTILPFPPESLIGPETLTSNDMFIIGRSCRGRAMNKRRNMKIKKGMENEYELYESSTEKTAVTFHDDF